MRSLIAVPVLVLVAGCLPMPDAMPSSLPFFNGSTERSETHSESRSEEHWVNGRRVDDWEEDEEDDREPRRGRKKETVAERETSDMGATCNRNTDCEMNACLTLGTGLGYCTKMCNSFSDCPTFWRCKRPGNAPQKVCMQD